MLGSLQQAHMNEKTIHSTECPFHESAMEETHSSYPKPKNRHLVGLRSPDHGVRRERTA